MAYTPVNVSYVRSKFISFALESPLCTELPIGILRISWNNKEIVDLKVVVNSLGLEGCLHFWLFGIKVLRWLCLLISYTVYRVCPRDDINGRLSLYCKIVVFEACW